MRALLSSLFNAVVRAVGRAVPQEQQPPGAGRDGTGAGHDGIRAGRDETCAGQQQTPASSEPPPPRAERPAARQEAPGAQTTGDATAEMWRLFRGLAPASLKSSERQRLGGLLFLGAPTFVRLVAQGLLLCPSLAAELQVSAAALLGRQTRAHCWLLVRAALSRMAALAGDSHLHEQGLAVEEAMRVVEVVRGELRHHALLGAAPPPPELEAKIVALLPAERVLALHEGRKRRVRKDSRREAQRQARAATSSPGTDRPPARRGARCPPEGEVAASISRQFLERSLRG